MSDSLIKAAEDLLRAVDEQHAAAQPPLKYTVPWDALTSLRAALNAARAQRVELSDAEIDAIGRRMLGVAYGGNTDRDFARAVLAAAGASEQDRVDAGSKTADGDYARMAEKCGAAVNWDGGGLYFKASAWGRFCDILREQSEGEKE